MLLVVALMEGRRYPYLTLPYLIVPYLTSPYLTLPCFTLPYLAVASLTLPYMFIELHEVNIIT